MTNFAFNPSEQIPFPVYAENKKFLPLSATDGTLDGDGRRYAVYTYAVNPSVINLSGTTFTANICSISVDNWNALIAETYSVLPLSADVTVRNVLNIAGVSAPVSTIEIKQPANVIIASDSFDAFDIYTVESVIKGVEVQNFTTGTVYIVPSSTSFENATAKGIGIGATGLYSTDRTITGFTMATVSAGDVRILLYT